MDPRLADLAARLKGELDAVEAGRQQAEAERAALQEAAREARRTLVRELAAFGRAVGHLHVDAKEDRLAFRYGSQRVAFLPEGDGDRLKVRIGTVLGPDEATSRDIDEELVHVYRHPDARVWVLAVVRDGEEWVEPLFEAGLVHLLTEGLGLPQPPPAPPSPQPPLDDLVPER